MIRLSCVLLFTYLVGTQSGTPTEPPLQRAVTDYQDGAAGFPFLLNNIAKRYEFPIGIELRPDALGIAASVQLKQGVVADVLEAVVRQMPGYKWDERSGVVNVMPADTQGSLLEVTIAHFQFEHRRLDRVPEAVVAVPEVKAWLDRNGVTQRRVINLLGSPDAIAKAQEDQPQVSADLANVTLREALNRVVKNTPLHRWQVTLYGARGKDLGIELQ